MSDLVPPLQPVVSFLGEHAPFDRLPLSERKQLAAACEIEYLRRGAALLKAGERCDRLWLVRSGGLVEEDDSGNLIAHYGEGAVVGAELLFTERASASSLSALQDTLLYTLPAERFRQLLRDEPALEPLLLGPASQRLRAVSMAPPRPAPGGASLNKRVRSLLVRPLVSVGADVSIEEAARRMTHERVSSVIVTGRGGLGIVTDRDLRSRVLASGANPRDPIHTIMSSPVAGVDVGSSLLEALMEMTRREVHHLAVLEDGAAVGVVTLSDLVQSHVANPVFVLNEVARQDDLEGVIRVSRRRADVLLQMVAADARASDTHRILTQVGDAITRRLIEITSSQLAAEGWELPSGYCWVSFGSQAREEHALASDQDNGLILSDSVASSNPALRLLAERVCSALDACGYPRCPGGIMALTDQWRQPASVWRDQFSRWIREPTKDAVMRGSIFFDMRPLHGESALATELADHVASEIAARPLFLAHLARDAVSRRPPLGFFGQLVVERGGEHKKTLDLKHQGLIPIVDLARLYGLESGCETAHTLVRLQHAAKHRVLSESGCSELMDAFECIGGVRLRLHARWLTQGKPADNYLDPTELSSAERGHLRDAFSVINTMQHALEYSRQLGLLGA